MSGCTCDAAAGSGFHFPCPAHAPGGRRCKDCETTLRSYEIAWDRLQNYERQVSSQAREIERLKGRLARVLRRGEDYRRGWLVEGGVPSELASGGCVWSRRRSRGGGR
jgi:hypothetical protein